MNTLQDRLKSFLEYLEIPMQTFERECGIGQGLGSKLSTKSYATTFKRISNAYPLLDIEWLRTGEGEMLLSTPSAPVNRNTEAIPGISELIATVRKQADIIMSQQETINELTKRLARNPK